MRIVAVADVVMSLDNVIAIAAAAKGNFVLIVFGLVVSVPLIVAGSAVLMRLLERYPLLIWGGAGLLGWVAGGLGRSGDRRPDRPRACPPTWNWWTPRSASRWCWP